MNRKVLLASILGLVHVVQASGPEKTWPGSIAGVAGAVARTIMQAVQGQPIRPTMQLPLVTAEASAAPVPHTPAVPNQPAQADTQGQARADFEQQLKNVNAGPFTADALLLYIGQHRADFCSMKSSVTYDRKGSYLFVFNPSSGKREPIITWPITNIEIANKLCIAINNHFCMPCPPSNTMKDIARFLAILSGNDISVDAVEAVLAPQAQQVMEAQAVMHDVQGAPEDHRPDVTGAVNTPVVAALLELAPVPTESVLPGASGVDLAPQLLANQLPRVEEWFLADIFAKVEDERKVQLDPCQLQFDAVKRCLIMKNAEKVYKCWAIGDFDDRDVQALVNCLNKYLQDDNEDKRAAFEMQMHSTCDWTQLARVVSVLGSILASDASGDGAAPARVARVRFPSTSELPHKNGKTGPLVHSGRFEKPCVMPKNKKALLVGLEVMIENAQLSMDVFNLWFSNPCRKNAEVSGQGHLVLHVDDQEPITLLVEHLDARNREQLCSRLNALANQSS